MAGGFGRRGLIAGAPAGGDSDEMSPKMRAFLAAERARRSPEPEPFLSDVAIATPSARVGKSVGGRGDRSMVVAYVLWWFAGILGAHRFYLRAYRSGFVYFGLFWGGLLVAAVTSSQSSAAIGGYYLPPPGIAMVLAAVLWFFVDAFLIPGLTRRANGRLDREPHEVFG